MSPQYRFFALFFLLPILPSALAKKITILDLEHQTCLLDQTNKSMNELPPAIDLDSFCGPHRPYDLIIVNGDMGSGLASKYSLKMNTSTHFSIGVNLQFIGAKDDVMKAKEKTKNCMDYFNHGPRFNLGPIKLSLSFDTLAPIHQIKVAKNQTRPDVENWPPDIACPTAIHEIMHVLGLVDEYEEKIIGPYPCRSLGPDNSIMSREDNIQREIHRADLYICFFPHSPDVALPTTRPTSPSPRSPEEVKIVMQAKNFYASKSQPQISYCPAGYFPGKIKYDLATGESVPEQIDRLFPKNVFDVVVMNPSVGQLNFYGSLYGGHISSIVYPGCVERNSIYYGCAGPSRLEVKNNKCPAKPQECGSSGWPGRINP